ncbi:MAG: Na-translocating system protein MpsC family protein, partial [bacterium]|nr:Na-translocating system protein MpsC family protein [bacterium]
EQLTKSAEGADLIKRTRMQLIEGARVLLENMVSEITGCQIRSLHTDISTKTGDRVIIFTLEQNLEDRFVT